MTIENDPAYIERREWLEENREYYVEAQEIFKDPQAMRGYLNILRIKTMEAYRYDPFQHPDSAAVGLLVKMQENLKEVFSSMEFIEEYEDRQKAQIAAVRAAEGIQPEGTGEFQTDKLG
jgi:hypothetical protein